MGTTASALLLGAAIVIAIASVSVWWTLRRPDKLVQRRRRVEALAAAQQVTPAPRVSPYGGVLPMAAAAAAVAPPAPDPCAPGLGDHDRVAAMRELLLRGDERHEQEMPFERTITLPVGAEVDELMSTTPMAWQSTLPALGLDFGDASLDHDSHEHVML